MSTAEQSEWLSTAQVGARYQVPEATVRKWRNDGSGPRGVRFGRHVRYAVSECERWEREQAAKSPQPAA